MKERGKKPYRTLFLIIQQKLSSVRDRFPK
jgi:hypothetical protein